MKENIKESWVTRLSSFNFLTDNYARKEDAKTLNEINNLSSNLNPDPNSPDIFPSSSLFGLFFIPLFVSPFICLFCLDFRTQVLIYCFEKYWLVCNGV